MAKFSKADSRRMYSWWWDSHISPKNSNWLQENLKDMDFRVKSMIKLIEEDADSFARRADMYFKKRPELMKMVEEFYRAYRSLAERYDHATRVIRHAHLTMAEAFPNQVPTMAAVDSPRSSVSGSDSTSSDPSTTVGDLMDESESVAGEKPLSHFNFKVVDEKEETSHDCDSEEIIRLKEAISKHEAEKEEGVTQYQQSLDILSQLENEIAKTKEEYAVLVDHVQKAESEIVILNKKLSEAEAEKELNLQKYQQSMEKISKLQEDAETLKDRAEDSEVEAHSLKGEIEKFAVEKDSALNQYMQLLEKVSNLENKLQFAEEDSRVLKERAEKAEGELEVLRATVTILTKEKEAEAEKYQQSLDKISGLEAKLDAEILSRDEKLRGAQEKFLSSEKLNQSLHMELEAVMLKVGTQSDELTEKEQEIVRLWASVQEERQRFVDAQAAFEALQYLHANTQEELQAVSAELQHRDQSLKIMEFEKKTLQDEVLGVKKENKQLEDVNASFETSVMDLKNENAGLRECWQREISEKSALLQKLGILDRLLEKNSVLESFLSDLHNELEAASKKIEKLEETLQSLLNERSTVIEEKLTLSLKLEEANKNLEKLSDDNTALRHSLCDAHNQLEALVSQLVKMEDSCQILADEKTGLKIENDRLLLQLETVHMKLDDLGRLYGEEENRCSALEEEKRSNVQKLEELQLSFEMEVLLLSTAIQELKESNHFLCDENLKFQEDISLLLSRLQALKALADENKIKATLLSTVLLILLRQLMEVNDELRESKSRKEAELSLIKDSFQISQGENLQLYAEKRCLMNEIRHLEEKNCFLEEENSVLFDKVLELDNLSMIFRTFSGEIMRDLQEIHVALAGKLSLTEERLEQSETENLHLDEKLRKAEEELKDSIALKNQSADENEVLLGRLESSMISQFLYEHKWNELQEACLSYRDENEDLKTELAAFIPDIQKLRECVSSLEDRTETTQLKFQHPENEKLEDAHIENASTERDPVKDVAQISSRELHDIRARLEVAVKAAHEKNDHMIQESADLHSQLDTSRKQLQLLQNEVQSWRMMKPKSQNTEASDSVSTKDIVLDQVSDCSSYHCSNKEMADENQIVELPDTSNRDSRYEKQASSHAKELKLNMHEVSEEMPDPKRESNKMSTSQRLETDVEKLVNLQMRIQDLKRKFDVIDKRRGSKPAVEFEVIRGKLIEAEKAVSKLIDINGHLMKSINKTWCLKSFSMFEVEDGIVRMKKVSQQAHKMSEKILNLQMEVQRLGTVIGKLRDDERAGRNLFYTDRKVVLRDYLYGIQPKKEKPQSQFSACLQLK